jgi:CheY-like chemotaxis protein
VEAEREALLARERETSRLKDEFVATVSHELRTPLGAILGWTQVLETTGLDQKMIGKAVSAIARSAEAQARVIEDLVDVSRIAAGKLHLRWEAVDFRAPVEASVEVVRASAQSRGIRIDTELPPRPCMVKGDPDRLRQVVGNLLSNAVKFSHDGGRISVVTRDLGNAYELEVSDEGIGIAPDVMPHIFDRYRQADSSTTRRHAGLGLGLAIVKEVTELHGGSVTVTSDGDDHGATFCMRLPAMMGAVLAPPAEEPSPTAVERLDGVRILAVDDNPDALDILSTALRAVGAEVHVAASGPEALEAWERETPDIVLCDLAMPGMDGFTVLEKIREQAVHGGRPPAAIAVSAHATLEHKRRSRAAGFAEHIAKPYRISDLVKAVNDALVGAP